MNKNIEEISHLKLEFVRHYNHAGDCLKDGYKLDATPMAKCVCGAEDLWQRIEHKLQSEREKGKEEAMNEIHIRLDDMVEVYENRLKTPFTSISEENVKRIKMTVSEVRGLLGKRKVVSLIKEGDMKE